MNRRNPLSLRFTLSTNIPDNTNFSYITGFTQQQQEYKSSRVQKYKSTKYKRTRVQSTRVQEYKSTWVQEYQLIFPKYHRICSTYHCIFPKYHNFGPKYHCICPKYHCFRPKYHCSAAKKKIRPRNLKTWLLSDHIFTKNQTKIGADLSIFQVKIWIVPKT